MKVEGESEILDCLVAVKLYSIAEMIRKENEKKKIKVKAPIMAKKDKKGQTSNSHISVS